MSAASLSINHYRQRTDTGSIDAAPTFGAAVDTNWNITNNAGFMIVFCVTNAGTTASSATTVKLQVSKNGGAFADVTTSSVTAITADVSSSADQTAVAVSEVTGTGSFVSGIYSEIGTTTTSVTIAGSSYTNFVYGVRVNPGQLFNRDTLQFKIVTVTGTSITATTIPTVTFTGGYVALDSQILFPNPQNRLLASAHVALRAQDETWVATNTTLLVGQDRVYGGAGQVADYDWINPQNRLNASAQIALRADAEAGGLNLALLVPPAVTYEPQAPVILAGAGPRRLSPDYVVSLNLNLQAVLPPADTTNTTRSPIFLRGWPAPASISLLTWTDQTRRHLIGQDALPIRQQDWQNPQRRLPPSAPLHFGRSPAEAVVVVTNPFVPVTWANPQRLRDALSAQIQPHRVAFSGLDTFFGAPGQVPTQVFPNPRGPQFPIDLRTYIQRAQIGPPPVMGQNNYDWPLPSFKARGPSMAVMSGNVVYVPVVTPPDTGQRHNLPFWATPGRLRSM